MKTFLASSQLFEVLNVFGEPSVEIKERQKYAKYRAAVIMKAVKAGEKPPLPEGVDEPQLPTFPPSNVNNEPDDTGFNTHIDPGSANTSIPPRPVTPSCSYPSQQPIQNVSQSKFEGYECLSKEISNLYDEC